MYRLTLLRWTPKKRAFELFCRDQLLVNYSLRELSVPERRVVMTKAFKELPEETLQDLKQRAAIEDARLAALQRAAAAFRPITPYEFFVKEQKNNPALGTSASPRDREVKLLQIYETLPEKAREALALRAEQYNTANSKAPTAPALPVVAVIKKKVAPVKSSKSAKKKKKKKKSMKKKKTKTKRSAKATTTVKASDAADSNAEVAGKVEKVKRKSEKKSRGPPSPYAVFVKEQMPSLHHLAPTERMRAIGERWRSLTKEERERRLEAARASIAAEATAPQASPSTPESSGAEAPSNTSTQSSSASCAPPTPTTTTLASQQSAQNTPSKKIAARVTSSPSSLPSQKVGTAQSSTPAAAAATSPSSSASPSQS